jgi:hypothetical protein
MSVAYIGGYNWGSVTIIVASHNVFGKGIFAGISQSFGPMRLANLQSLVSSRIVKGNLLVKETCKVNN